MTTQYIGAVRSELRSWAAANLPEDLWPERAGQVSEAERVPRLRVWQATLSNCALA